MKENVSESLCLSKNSLESKERNLNVDENDAKEVKKGGIGLVLFYLFAIATFNLACLFRSAAIEFWQHIKTFHGNF